MRRYDPRLTDLYFRLLDCGLHPGKAFEPTDPVDARTWQALYSLTVRQGTTSIVLDAVGRLLPTAQPPRELRIRWAVQAEANAKRYGRQTEAAARAARLLAGHGIRMLLLKGIGLGALYPAPAHRESGDVDVYLFGELEAGNRILREAGAKIVDDVPKHTGLVWHGVHFENHRNFLNVNRNPQERELDALLCGILHREGASQAPDGWLTPSATFNAVYLVRHAALHFLKEGISARHLCDWSCFLERQGGDIDRGLFSATMKRFGMERFERLFTAAAIRCCGLQQAMPEHDPSALQRFIAEILDYRPVPLRERPLARLVRKCRTPFEHRWRFRLLSQSLAEYYREVLRAQRRERFTLFR